MRLKEQLKCYQYDYKNVLASDSKEQKIIMHCVKRVGISHPYFKQQKNTQILTHLKVSIIYCAT